MGNWTQPQCERCWVQQNSTWEQDPELGPDAETLVSIRTPVVSLRREINRCAWCGEPTIIGIFVRVNPEEVPFPSD